MVISGTETRTAEFSADRFYRYVLKIVWDAELPQVTFIGLNPSVADEFQDDPTIRRCKQFAKDFGGGSLCMLNLFGWRSTNPYALADVVDPCGDRYRGLDVYKDFAAQSSVTIAAWGNYIKYFTPAQRSSVRYRGLDIAEAIPQLMCLKWSEATNTPWHPLYLKGDLRPIPFVR